MALRIRQLARYAVSKVAYSTGLRIGRRLVEITREWIGAPSPAERTMSTAKAEVMELLAELPDDCTPEQIEHALRARDRRDASQRRRMVRREQARARLEGGERNAKGALLDVLDELPDDCSMEDIQYNLYVQEQIRAGIWSLENEPTYTQEEVEQSLSRWLTD